MIAVWVSRTGRGADHVWGRRGLHPWMRRDHAVPGLQRVVVGRSRPDLASARFGSLLRTVLSTLAIVVVVVGWRH